MSTRAKITYWDTIKVILGSSCTKSKISIGPSKDSKVNLDNLKKIIS